MKTAKRFAMLAGLALALMAVPSFAGETAKTAPESDFEFRLSKDGTFIAITGYKGNTKNLVIPETIQGLPVEVINGFEGNMKIKSVVIPSSVKVIVDSAFYECTSLEKVTLSEGLLHIGRGAFSSTGLTSVTLPKSIEILFNAFKDCDNLAEINIPDDAAFLFKNSEAAVFFLEKGYTEDMIADYGESIFSGSKINRSVALQKKLREIKLISGSRALDYYFKAKEIYKKYEIYFPYL